MQKNIKISAKMITRPGVKVKQEFLTLSLAFLFLLSSGCGHLAKEPERIFIGKDKNNRSQLIVDNKPYIINGVCYNPMPIGKDNSYDLWQQDIGVFKMDGDLMKDLGVNTIRIYQPGPDVERTKEIINFFYKNFRIRTVMGNWLGFWEGIAPDYANLEFRKRVKDNCLQMVKEFKDEPAILIWTLGNENNFSFGKEKLRVWTSPQLDSVADPMKKREAMAEIYYKFVNELAGEIKKIDKAHPVALGNGGLDNIEIAQKFSGNLDLLACSVYNGKSFGSAFSKVKNNWGKPFLFSEFGCDSFDALKKQPDEDVQTEFISSQWKEIKRNLVQGNGEGNCLGGFVFEWSDEWWKHNDFDPSGYSIQDEGAGWPNGAYYFDIAAEKNLNMNEEWWGIVKIGERDGAPIRVPKKVFYTLKDSWKE